LFSGEETTLAEFLKIGFLWIPEAGVAIDPFLSGFI